MSDEPPQGLERRVYPRYDVALSVEFEITGGEPAGPTLQGTTINISRGGVLVDVGIGAAPEATCRIAFLDAGDAVAPGAVTGRVVHSGMWKHGGEAVAVQFDTPLDKLEPPEGI